MYTNRIVRGLAAALLISGAAWFTTNSASAAGAIEQTKGKTATPTLAARAERCAVEATPADQLELIEQAASNGTDPGGVVTIPVYWHVITTTKGDGDISARIPAQMDVLRDAYAGSKFVFELKEVQVVRNNTWFFGAAGSDDEVAMKNALRKGGPETLNIYTNNGDVYLGWATLPFYYKFGPSYDGVVLWWASLPGTGLAGTADEEPDGVLTYDQGDTGTHEVGHRLGLEHTSRQLHGLRRRRVHGHLHGGPDRARAHALARVPRQGDASPGHRAGDGPPRGFGIIQPRRRTATRLEGRWPAHCFVLNQ
jgi:hypothetical protein